jgi:hypothetical protein
MGFFFAQMGIGFSSIAVSASMSRAPPIPIAFTDRHIAIAAMPAVPPVLRTQLQLQQLRPLSQLSSRFLVSAKSQEMAWWKSMNEFIPAVENYQWLKDAVRTR